MHQEAIRTRPCLSTGRPHIITPHILPVLAPSSRTSLPCCRKIRNRKLLVENDELIGSIWLTSNVAAFHGSTVAFRRSLCRIILCAASTGAAIGRDTGVVYAGCLKH